MNLTDKQRSAVYERNKSLLVSAAAGSGKTSVLTQRILAMVEEGADIRNMLVCTFTNAAAEEMRERISAALMKRAAETGNVRLRAQAEYVCCADILTLHKFSIKVVRENFLLLGVSKNVRVGAENENKILKAKAFAAATVSLRESEELELLRGMFSSRDDRQLMQVLFQLYDFMMSRPERLGWIDTLLQRDDLCDVYLAMLQQYIAEKTGELLEKLKECEQIGIELQHEKQMANDADNIFMAKGLLDAIVAGDFIRYEALLAEAKLHGLARGVKEFYGTTKDEASKILGELKELGYSETRNALIREEQTAKEVVQAFATVINAFDMEYMALKREKNVMDFDDMQHFALKVLQNESAAAYYQEKYEYIFVDEYQDTNLLQEALISRIARENNLFLVGDVKQSIYRFRLADCEIFRDKAKAFEKQGQLVYMNENFRSADRVTDAVNGVMCAVMSEELGEVVYTENEALCPMLGKEGKAELLLTETGAFEDSDENESVMEKEAKTVAECILSLLGEGTALKDICILMRSRSAFPAFLRVLEAHGIPAVTDQPASDPAEIEVFINFLRLADSTPSDIALLSAMRFWGFDENEFAEIRSRCKKNAVSRCICRDAPQRYGAWGQMQRFCSADRTAPAICEEYACHGSGAAYQK